ncbi:hypothetical protein [Amycolatopsis sp. 195334CR]|uniref:hypothetical protein n=1 Tax=Amycolatopsis sp. 195334CR TaxID=2814588 RepID=UPI001A8C0259|nr:hypothetical protein [Amycolatopsis sp. 195334CR]MBN6041696.1 hypothetical protein [Amycolatopsis sp. 195334CR]
MNRWTAPLEVKVITGLLVGIALVHILISLILLSAPGSTVRVLFVPVTALVLGAIVAGGLAVPGRFPRFSQFSRYIGYAVIAIMALQHAFGMLAGTLWWLRIFFGLAAAGYIYAGVLLSSRPVLRHVGSAKA